MVALTLSAPPRLHSPPAQASRAQLAVPPPPKSSGHPLVRVIQADVLPRLAVAQRAAARPNAVPDIVEQLAGLLARGEDAAATAIIEGQLAAGQPIGALCLELLAPAARRLGELWAEDVCGFAEVTLGTERLRRILRGLEDRAQSRTRRPPAPGRDILLTLVPGEQHGFGLEMLGLFFRQSGWQVRAGSVRDAGELGRLVAARPYGVVGLSAGSEASLARLPATIRAIRRASRNPAVAIMVGGPACLDDPGIAARVGADGGAADARQAVALADRLLAGSSVGARPVAMAR